MVLSEKNNSDGRVVTLIVSATGAASVATVEWGRAGDGAAASRRMTLQPQHNHIDKKNVTSSR